MPKEIKVTNVSEAKCAAAVFTLDDMAQDLIDLRTSLQLACEGKRRVEQDGGKYFFPRTVAEVKADSLRKKLLAIIGYIHDSEPQQPPHAQGEES